MTPSPFVPPFTAGDDEFRELADAMPQIVYVTGPDGRTAYINRRWREYTGQAGADTQDLVAVVHPDDIDSLLAKWRAAVRGCTPLTAEYRLRRHDGVYRWFLTRSVPAAGGKWYGTSTDIHDIKDAAAAARATDAILAATPDLVYVFDRGHRFTYANPALLAMWGKTRADALGRTCLELGYEPWHAAMHDREIDAVVATGKPVRGEVPFTGTNGRRVYDYIFAPVFGPGGEVEAVAGVTRDVTDRKAVEVENARLTAELGRKVRELAALLDAAPVGIAVATDPGCGEIRSNRAMADMLGMAHDQNVSMARPNGPPPYRVFRDGRQVPAAELPVERAARRGETVTGEMYEFARPDGTAIAVMVNAVPVRDAAGVITGAVGVCSDVTALRNAQDALREADRRKDDFLATLAHELRNPLAPIRNGLEILRTPGAPEAAVARARAVMDRQLGHMVVIIDDLLDASRITRGKLTLRREPMDLRDAVADAADAARPLIDRHRHDFTLVLPPGPVCVDGDRTRLAQVYGNLLTNAAKYTPPGGAITLTLAAAGGTAAVAVTDTGTGIPAAALDGIFGLFNQIDRPLEKTAGGLGIGLALVKGLVEMHGGRVTAESPGEGAGSTFTVTLPTIHPPAEVAPAAEPEAVKIRPKRVLVVDDNEDSAESLSMLLELSGHEVRTAHDGVAAVAAAGDFRPDLILMDVGMPKLNGLDATRRIREHPWGGGIHVVALTGWGERDDRDRTAAAGCDGHLVKPVDPATVFELLAKLEE